MGNRILKFSGSIKRKWFLNTFAVTLLVLVIANIFANLAIHSYYYGNISQMLTSRAKMNADAFDKQNISDYTTLSNYAMSRIQDFEEQERYECQILDQDGNVIITSSGFSTSSDQHMPDYVQVMSTHDQQVASWSGINPDTGERIMGVSASFSAVGEQKGGAIRYVVSMKAVDRQILVIAMLLLASSALIVLILFLVGLYFVRSIVTPINEIITMSKRISSGDFAVRIDTSRYDEDEIGELCQTINNMAADLESTDKMKNDFLSSVSHELRTPLTAIKGWSETMLGCSEEDFNMIERGLKIISGETDRLSAMVEELLNFSRIQSGRMRVNKRKIDVLSVFEETVYLFMARAKYEQLTLEYEAQDVIAPVYADPDMLRQVFINVLDNSFKYSEPGGVNTAFIEEEGDFIKIVVKDTGIGIAPDELPHIKEQFFKGSSQKKGTGIGLAVADEIIRRHDGRLEIASEVGVGTTVSIYLPIYHGEEV